MARPVADSPSAGSPVERPRVVGFKGIDNRTRPVSLGLEWQLDALNVVCDRAGWLRKRPGGALVRVGLADVYAVPDGRFLAVDASARLLDLATGETLAEGVTGAPFSWFSLGTAAFAVSPRGAWAVYPDRVVPWGVPCCPAPTLAVVVAPGSPAGRRLVACVLQAPDGRVGGTAALTAVELTDGQGLEVHAPSVVGYTTRVYASPPDGEVAYLCGVCAPGDPPLFLTPDVFDLAYPLDTLQCLPPPLGERACAWRGRAVVAEYDAARGFSALYFSRVGAPHLFEVATDFQMFAGRVTALGEIPDGLVVATDREVTLLTADWSRREIWSVGAPAGDAPVGFDGLTWLWTQLGALTPADRSAPALPHFVPAPSQRVAQALWPYQGSRYLIATLTGRPETGRPVVPHDIPTIVDTHEHNIEV